MLLSKIKFFSSSFETLGYNDTVYDSVQALKVNYFFFFPNKTNTLKF